MTIQWHWSTHIPLLSWNIFCENNDQFHDKPSQLGEGVLIYHSNNTLYDHLNVGRRKYNQPLPPPSKPYGSIYFYHTYVITCIILKLYCYLYIDLPIRNIKSFVYRNQPCFCTYFREAKPLVYFWEAKLLQTLVSPSVRNFCRVALH